MGYDGRGPLRLAVVRDKEPVGWPLTRPLTHHEWAHVVKLMVMRRVPKSGSIQRLKLIRYVKADLQAASDAGKLFTSSLFKIRSPNYALDLMSERDRTLGRVRSIGIHRTDYADEWIGLVPITVRTVAEFLPTTSVLDLMVQALIDCDV